MFKKIFDDKHRIVALPGDKNSGKTNNIVRAIIEYRKEREDVPIYAFGLPEEVMKFLKKCNVTEISSLKQMIKKRDCFLIIDEFQKLRLNDRRNKQQLDEFIDFIYHRNVYVLLSSPNIREFNTVIGGKIERWLLKTISIDNCINGSQLKEKIDEYNGKYKFLGMIEVPKNEILLINDDSDIILNCAYVREADTKKKNKDLF